MQPRVNVLFSVWLQIIGLHGTSPSVKAACLIVGQLLERAFLDGSWDHVVSPAGDDLRLKISALPHQIFAVGAQVWLEFDPSQMAAIVG